MRTRVLLRLAVGAVLSWLATAPCATAQGDAGAPGLRAARTLARGDTITAADIAADSGATADPASLIGWVARRVISEGELLRPPGVGRPIVMRAGSPITVVASAGRVTVSRSGVAMFDAGLGDSVRVRLDARASVVGVVADRTTVILH